MTLHTYIVLAKIKFVLRLFTTLSRILTVIILSAVLIVLGTASLFYTRTEIFYFPQPKTFSGAYFYNPYQSVYTDTMKCNFHAHSISWSGVTNGSASDSEVVNVYKQHHYDIAAVSNYHQFSTYKHPSNSFLFKVYEHGYNPLKSHLLVMNSEKVNYFDFPVIQSIHHQQGIINMLNQSNSLVTLAHPEFGGGRKLNDFEKLCNYQFIEVLNHYRNSEKYWDRALSSGRLCWALGNDDIHDPSEENTCKIFTLVLSRDRQSKREFLNALKSGRTICYKTVYGNAENQLKSCKLNSNGVLSIELKNKANSIHFIGKGGEVRKALRSSKKANYRFLKSDPFIRVKIINDRSEMYLNPVFRTNQSAFNFDKTLLKPTVNRFCTYLTKILFVAISMALYYLDFLLLRNFFRRKLR